MLEVGSAVGGKAEIAPFHSSCAKYEALLIAADGGEDN